MRKRTIYWKTILLILSVFGYLKGNPIPINYMNELLISTDDPQAWILEIKANPFMGDNLDGLFFVTSSGTAHIKSGISTQGDELLLLTSDSLLTPLSFNIDQGVIALFDSLGNRIEELRWGDVADNYIAPPLPGQSICYAYQWPAGEAWYLDNSPTLGSWNDQEGGQGSISGLVLDANGTHVENAQVLYGYGFTTFVTSDEDGRYDLHNNACLTHIRVNILGVDYFDSTLQVYPDSTINLDCHLQNYVGLKQLADQQLPKHFKLIQNYPNPFNPTTTIRFDVSEEGPVHIDILRLDGSLVATLVHDELPPGTFEMKWDAGSTSSGVYLYRMQARSFSSTRKMIIVK